MLGDKRLGAADDARSINTSRGRGTVALGCLRLDY